MYFYVYSVKTLGAKQKSVFLFPRNCLDLVGGRKANEACAIVVFFKSKAIMVKAIIERAKF